MRSNLARESAALLVVVATTVSAAELLNARISTEDGEPVAFRLAGESREEVIGGTIELGSRSFTITDVSMRGLIGASRAGRGDDGATFAEYAVFSSSFSEQTAVGQPWAAARRYLGCEVPYNSFLAVYHVDGDEAVAALGPRPYPRLMDDESLSGRSDVYCFVSKPPG